jgi:hypothetical protein
MDIVERIKVEKWTNRDGEDVTSYPGGSYGLD